MMRTAIQRAFQLNPKSFFLQRAFSQSSSVHSSNKVYEYRQYQIRPEKFSEFNQLFTKYSHLRTSQSKLVGYWFTELGSALGKAVHIWEYDDLDHRAQVRKTLAGDEEWTGKFISKAIHFWSTQENCTMTLPSWINQVPELDKKNGIYEMTTLSLANGRPMHSDASIEKHVKAQAECGGDLIGAWYQDSGDLSKGHVLWRYNNFQEREEVKQLMNAKGGDLHKLLKSEETMVLLPAPYSPLQ